LVVILINHREIPGSTPGRYNFQIEITSDATRMKIPNIVVNAISVLIMSLNNSAKANEKFECFKRLSQQFMILSQEIEGMDQSIEKEKYIILLL